jgi:hypothetical protein
VSGAVLEKVFAGHGTCVTWAPIRLTNFQFVVHVCPHSVVTGSKSEQSDLVVPAKVAVGVILVISFRFISFCFISFHFILCYSADHIRRKRLSRKIGYLEMTLTVPI